MAEALSPSVEAWFDEDEERVDPPPPPSLREQLIASFRPANLASGLLAGLVTGIISATGAIAFGSLLFSGPFSAYASAGIGFLLFGGMVLAIIPGIFSSVNGVVAGVQDTGIAVMLVIATVLGANASAVGVSEPTFITMVAAVVAGTVLTGIVFLLLGFLRLGDLIRFIPYPVIGGFLSGSGLLLVKGGVSVMTDAPIVESLITLELIAKWVPGLLFAVAMLVVMNRWSHFLIVPGILAAGIVIFFVVLLITGTPVAEATANGWLLGDMPTGSLWQPVSFAQLAEADWGFVFAQIGTLLSVSVVLVISILLNASGIELHIKQDVDLNHELKVLGLSNIVAGLGASPPGAHYLGSTALVYEMRAASRLVGIVQAIVLGVVLFAGASLLTILPKFVLGGLILYFGIAFLIRWVIEARSEMTSAEYIIVLMILGVIFFVGFLEGVALGVVLAVVLFVVNYSRINVIKHVLSGANHQSTVDRPKLYRDLLQRKGHWLYMLKLQGFVFFGTANTLFHQFKDRIEDKTQQKPRYFLLDFHLVTGVDSSAMLSFQKMLQLAEQHEITLIFSSLSDVMKVRLSEEPFASQLGTRCMIFPDLDHGMEWYENQVIENFESVGFGVQPPTMTRQLRRMLPDRDAREQMMSFLQEINLEEGEVLFEQGAPPCGIYFVESGTLRVDLVKDVQRPVRLRTVHRGTILGELSTYLRTKTSGRVTANEPSKLFLLSPDKLDELEEQNPEVAAPFHRFMINLIAERLVGTTETMAVLLD